MTNFHMSPVMELSLKALFLTPSMALFQMTRVIAKVKSVLRTDIWGQSSPLADELQADAAMDGSESRGNGTISVVVEGVAQIEIRDKNGNLVYEDWEALYIQDSFGAAERIGAVWMVRPEVNRKQYVLNSGDYTIDLSGLKTDGERVEACIIYVDTDYRHQSVETYLDFHGAKEARIILNPENAVVSIEAPSRLSSPEPQTVYLDPTNVWSKEEINRLNEATIDKAKSLY